MTFMRMPMFIWAMLVTTILILLAFPWLTVGLIFLFLDRYFGTHYYLVELGATPMLWQHLFWLFGHPEVYIMVLPAFGMISEILPVFSRKPLFGYADDGLLDGADRLSVVRRVGPPYVRDRDGSGGGLGVFDYLDADRDSHRHQDFQLGSDGMGRSLRMTTAFLFAVAAVLQFTLGGLSGVMHASPPIDLEQTDTYFVVAHFHYVLFGGMMFAILGAFYYWWPKITGRMLNEISANGSSG